MIFLTEEQLESLKLCRKNNILNFKGNPKDNDNINKCGYTELESRIVAMYSALEKLTGLAISYNKWLNMYIVKDIGHPLLAENENTFSEDTEHPYHHDKIKTRSCGCAWGETVLEAYENLLCKKEGMYCAFEDFPRIQAEKIVETMEAKGWILYKDCCWCSPEEAVEKHGYKYAEDGSLVKKESIDYLKEKLNL